MKPYPIPDLEGEDAEDFDRKNREAPTESEKRMVKEGIAVFAQTKKYKGQKASNKNKR